MRRRALLSGGKKDYSQDYFTMVVTAGGNITWKGSADDNILYYSKDNGATWTATDGTAISVTAGDKILWKGTPTPVNSSKGIGSFKCESKVKYSVEGNVMSLLFGDDFKGKTSLERKKHAFSSLFSYDWDYSLISAENLSLPATYLEQWCYYVMFKDCSQLTTPPELPATSMAYGCYQGMFDGCSSLTTAPKLPATDLYYDCYAHMFYRCSSLTTAPELPAKYLYSGCYRYMFCNCTSLNSIKCLATSFGASDCTTNWVNGVAASGTFTKKSWMSSWTTGDSGIPEGWTVQNA